MRFRGLVYRAHNPQWSWTPLSGEGARRHGGRFNRRGIPALYTSLSPLTAIREAQPLGRPMQPLTLCAYEVDVEPVVDALDEDQCRALGVDDSDLVCPTWEAEMLAGVVPASQVLADRLIAAGYAGMQVWSFAAGTGTEDLNLVMWKWGSERPHRVVLIDDESRLSGGRMP
jgi:RES domain-containing protein